MRFLKRLLLFFLILLIIIIALIFYLPTRQTIVKTIAIQAPASKIYEHLLSFQDINNLTGFAKMDSSIKFIVNGPPGEVGSTVYWQGSPVIAGKGEIRLTEFEKDKQLQHHITFFEPKYIEADSKITIQPQKDYAVLTWMFTVPFNRPINLFGLFYNLEKDKGKIFKTSLAAFKSYIESQPLLEPELKINQTYFPYTNFVAIKQKVAAPDYTHFLSENFSHLSVYTLKGQFSNPLKTTLFYSTPDSVGVREIAAALPIPVGYNPELHSPEQIVIIPASKAISVFFKESKKDQAYDVLNSYVQEQGLHIKQPVIEQYPTDSATSIIYLIE